MGPQGEPVKRRWESATRYYVVVVQQNLFGDWELVQVWGGRRNALGRVRCVPVSSYLDGLAALERVGRVRARRSYRLV